MAGQSNLYDVSVGDLTACTGVGVFKQFEGHGIGSQAVALLYDWAMRLPKDGGLGMRRLWAGVSPWNEGSKALHSRLGLKAEGTRRAFEVTVEPMYGEHGQSPSQPGRMVVAHHEQRGAKAIHNGHTRAQTRSSMR